MSIVARGLGRRPTPLVTAGYGLDDGALPEVPQFPAAGRPPPPRRRRKVRRDRDDDALIFLLR